MLEKRIIPVLLLQNRKLVKSINFSKFNYLGDPINAVKIFSSKTVDELVVVDINASKKNTIDFDYLYKIANECFIPLTYCGGVNDLKSMEKIYKIGFEKIALDSATFLNKDFPNEGFLNQALNEFGSSSIVVSMTVRKNFLGKYKLYDHVLKKNRKIDINIFLQSIIKNNPGEIFLNNVSADGLMNGYDVELVSNIASKVNVPLTVCGGAGNIQDAKNILEIQNVTGAAAGSIFVYSSKNKGIMINYPL